MRNFGTKTYLIVLALGIVVSSGVIRLVTPPSTTLKKQCGVAIIFNFGDSNSDTGSNSAIFGRTPHPNGITFFGKPCGRVSDGRLIIDFIAEKLGLQYLGAYLDAIEANFEGGANFAAYGATIQPANTKLYGSGANPLALNIQLLQFHQFKLRSLELYGQAKKSKAKPSLPRPKDYLDALYTFDIGQNDIDLLLKAMKEDQARQSLPEIINYFSSAILRLHNGGARKFWIHNTGPFGCLPIIVEKNSQNSDEIGCRKSYNELAQEYNRQLKNKVSELRAKLDDSLLVYVDIYSIKYSLIKDAKKIGFDDPFNYCCKECAGAHVPYWKRKIEDETEVVHATPCHNPSQFISWDGVHYTEAANRWVANRIFDGSFSDPPLPYSKSFTLC